uniref:GPI mannosyltransferase 2 n=1 Tax=Rhizophora mucronata TaxID=61149 RepID=A0A2P2ILB7_RHIMU
MLVTENQSLRQRKQTIEGDDCAVLSEENVSLEEPGYLSSFIVPCTLHLAFMAATAFFVMHVQVATRFLSTSPPLYWFASYLMVCPGSNRWGYVIWAYSAAYILLGSLLFSNFYPFT